MTKFVQHTSISRHHDVVGSTMCWNQRVMSCYSWHNMEDLWEEVTKKYNSCRDHYIYKDTRLSDTIL